MDLIRDKEDSFKRAAANIMLNSRSEYLVELEAKYRGKLGSQDANLLTGEAGLTPVNEQ